MAEYAVELKPAARKELDRLPLNVVERVFSKLESLAENPRPPGCKKLKGGSNEWRIRVGDYRVVYFIDDPKQLVGVTRIRHRREVYED
jgi:mRNA interferase RelE/StbE